MAESTTSSRNLAMSLYARNIQEALGLGSPQRAYNAHCQDKMTLKKREVCEKHISLFNFGTAAIRVIPAFKDGQPYFVAKDVAEALGFKNTSKAINDHCKGNDSLSIGRGSAARLINEGDLYRLVMRSNLPSAQAFQDWVCGTVLPAIRKDGAYVMGEEKGINGK
ncbi:Bro-N domain-containing protein [Shewanella chilikensis]|uniref:BRO-N domain-containing protein n=1 Tax=Shewanella chilikensis TaxID=558541 RepID=UPI003A96973C